MYWRCLEQGTSKDGESNEYRMMMTHTTAAHVLAMDHGARLREQRVKKILICPDKDSEWMNVCVVGYVRQGTARDRNEMNLFCDSK